DTIKIAMVLAPQVVVKGRDNEGKANLTKDLQAVFDCSSQRQLELETPPFSRYDSPLRSSGFWDFDILDPQITIEGDSAFVDCELVLWGAPPDGKTRGPGRRINERFVFVSPPKVEPATVPDGSHRWPEPSRKSNFDSSRRHWELVCFENLVGFLGDVGSKGEVIKKGTREGSE
ncbi:MAG: hypothetical protein AB1744_09030, partial [Candidatus Zixiibacteriota bacterium]